MFMKKWLIGLVMFQIILFVTTLGAHGAFAETSVVTKPMETAKIDVELNDDNFNPKVITLANGKTTTLTLKNKGVKEHTFTVEKLGIDAEVQPGKEKTITVTPKNPGTYELICKYHYKEGMVGRVIVK
ncbi:cupredoxin domain-containing protein [Neobacillus sp. K501]